MHMKWITASIWHYAPSKSPAGSSYLSRISAQNFSLLYFIYCIWYSLWAITAHTHEERGVSVVECLTQDRGVTGSSLIWGTVLWLRTGLTEEDLSPHDWKNVDRDVKNRIKQNCSHTHTKEGYRWMIRPKYRPLASPDSSSAILCTVKPVLSGHSKIDKTKVFKRQIVA